MSPADQRSGSPEEAVYHLIFLNGVLQRPPPLDVVNLHAVHLEELDKAGKFVLAGPIPERAGGLIVLRTKSLVEARAIADEDPMVRGGYQTYELGTWFMSNRQNAYRPSIQGANK